MAEDSKMPALRGGNVGLLALRVLGDPENGTPMDITAVPLLYEALIEEGDTHSASVLRLQLCDLVGMLNGPEDFHHRRAVQATITENVRQLVNPLVYDFNSVCYCFAGFLERASAPVKVTSSETKLNTVKVKVTEGTPQGVPVDIDDGRRGIVVSARDKDGYVDVMPLAQGEGYGDMGESPGPGRYSRPMQMRRR
jgi:hypothetical protein